MNFGKKGIQKRKQELNAKGPRWKRKFNLIGIQAFLILLVSFFVIMGSAGIGVFQGILASAPDISNIDVSPTGYSTFVYDSDGNQIAKLVSSDSNRIPVTMSEIPENLAHAFVAIEDERFYEHNGIDIQGIVRAFFIGVTSGDFSQGASTITQQLLKNNVFSDWTNETFMEKVQRKIQEQYLALQLEKVMDKDSILENYMNTINLGQNTLGVQAASLRYFNKNVEDLTLSECAVLAAITQNPSKYNPITHPENNAERREKVLDNMLELGYITQDEYDEAINDDVYSRIQSVNSETDDDSVTSYFVDALVDEVMDDLEDAGYSENEAYTLLYSGGLKIYSTQDSSIQEICDTEFANEDNYAADTKWELAYDLTVVTADGDYKNYSESDLEDWFEQNGESSYSLLYDSEDAANADIETFKENIIEDGEEEYAESVTLTPEPQASITVEDQSTGYVVAMEGGRGTKTASRTLNRATDTTRQPGSTFKVLSTYAPALDSAGLTLATTHMDEPYTYENGTSVSNWYSGYRGICSLRDAIRDSLNIITVKTLTEITPQLGYDYLENFGFSTLVANEVIDGQTYSDIQQSLALGGITNGVTNMELNAAYATIANGGTYHEPILYTKITDQSGNVILDKTESQESRRVIKATTAFLLTDAMEDVVTSGTGTAASFDNMSIAGKTGTTSDYKDEWFAGYTPYYTATVWTGFDDNTVLSTSAERAVAKKLWRAVMKDIHADLPNESFEVPDGIVTATVCSKSGLLPIDGVTDAFLKTEYFAEGTVPTEQCNLCYQGELCAYDNLPASDDCPFKVSAIFTLNPDDLTSIVEINGTAVDSIPVTTTCEHDATFFADPNYEATLEAQQQELALQGITTFDNTGTTTTDSAGDNLTDTLTDTLTNTITGQ